MSKKPTATKQPVLMPSVATRGTVVFPNMALHFDIGRKKSVKAIKAAMKLDRQVFLVCQKDLPTEDPQRTDLYKYGVVATIKQVLYSNEGVTRVLIEGNYKAKIVSADCSGDYITCEIAQSFDKPDTMQSFEQEAIIRATKAAFDAYCKFFPKMPPDIILKVSALDDPTAIFEAIVPNTQLHYTQKQELLEFNSQFLRLIKLIEFLNHEVDVLSVEGDIYSKVKGQMDKNQRDYFLREQQKAIAEELGEGLEMNDDVYDIVAAIDSIVDIDAKSREKLLKDCYRLSEMPMQSQEANVLRTYLETCLDLPWDTKTCDNVDLTKASMQLERDHYGLKQVKERILESLAVRILSPDIKGQILCLVGPPGVGKTSIAKSVAKAMKRKYVRVSLGGVHDEAEIRGHRKTYVGSMPGRIITAIKECESKNPVMLLDEIDKMGADFKGDPASAMLEVLDSEQNSTFRDHYIEVPFDLSATFFITTANTTSTIPAPLLDRREIIELTSYTREEKFNIAKKHLLAKQMKNNGIKKSMMLIKDDAIYTIIDNYVKEAGVRGLERSIGKICRKVAKSVVMQESKKVVVTSKNIDAFLGPQKYIEKENANSDKIGVTSGLAWTSVGGEMLNIEVAVMNGTGKVKLTGSLGDVMKESADIAISFVRTISDEYDIKPDFYKTCDIHIHAPEGAVPKDGPSAGVTMVTSIVSALTGIPVRGDIAMTGEISLCGDVLPIGGLREKSMAAYKENKKTVIIPMDNKSDITLFDDVIKENINFIPVENIKDVLEISLCRKQEITQDKQFQWVLHKPNISVTTSMENGCGGINEL
ncbi:MAG: endopeptidase La [Oscillospiraceae bacterium]